MHRTTISEAVAAPTPTESAGRLSIGIITPGWGSSGYYSAAVLQEAAKAKVWPAGTKMFLDHPSESELFDRPERSVRDIAAVLTEDARWDGDGLVAEAQVIGPFKELLTDPAFAETVGVSIRASAETATGEAEGRTGTIITRLVEGSSVDFVTKAGRGGRVLAVIESARAEAREALTRETRDLLQLAVGDQAWVVDFDPDAAQVIYRAEWQNPDGSWHSALLRDGYTVDGGAATLAGSAEEVRQSTSYVPVQRPDAPTTESDVPAPAGRPQETEESEEDTMPQIEEARLRQLEEAAGRVQTAEAERDEARRERDQYRAREAATARARTRISEANADLAPATVDRIVAEATRTLPLTENGRLDEAAFDQAVDTARTAEETYLAGLAESTGAGTVSGFGGTRRTTTASDESVSEADLDQLDAGVFGTIAQEA